MKKNYCIPALILASSIFASCANDISGTDEMIPDVNTELAQDNSTRAFPEKDNSTPLSGTPAEKLYRLLLGADEAMSTTYAEYKLTNEQYEEIKTFTDEIVGSAKRFESQIYSRVFKWITENVSYAEGYISNEPYDVFKTKVAVCQGYANLLNVMLRSQGLHVINANGFLIPGGGHAWNYVKYGNKWYLSDPTNNIKYTASETHKYSGQFAPLSADGHIIENDAMAFNYVNESMNINIVKASDNAFVAPYSITLNNGDKVRITSFCPTQEMPENVTEVYIGSNINSLGSNNTIGLRDHGKNIEAAHVDPENQILSSFCGVVYHTDMSEPLYIPNAMTRMTLRQSETVGKNFVYNHPNLEELHIMEGTKKLEAWAVEKCPNLKVVYIPFGTECDPKAFVDVHPSFQIIRQDQTGIKDVLAD